MDQVLKPTEKAIVTIIIMNHNRKELLDLCVSSVLSHTAVPYELWIIDWKSKDDTRAFIKEKYLGKVTRVVFDDSNLGYAACNTKYMKECSTPYIMLLNNDCAVFPGYLREAIKCFESDPKVGHVAQLVLRENFLVMSHGANVDFNCNTVIPMMNRAFNDPILATPGNYAYAGFGLYKTDVARELDWLEAPRPDFAIYWDDCDFGMKVNAAGLDVRYCPSSIIMHRMTIDENRGHHASCLNEGRFWYKARWGEFLAKNSGYMPPFPKGDYPVPFRSKV